MAALYASFFSIMVLVAGCSSSREESPTLLVMSVTPGSQTISVNANQQFVAVGTFSDNTTRDLTSQVTWTCSDPEKASINNRGLATGVSAGSTIITASSGTISAGSSLTITASSLPGYNWTARSVANDLRRVSWLGNQFVALDNLGIIFTSPDGVTWTAQTLGLPYQINGVTWSGTQFVAVGFGQNGAAILNSSDAVTWTPQITPQTPPDFYNLMSITWSRTKFVAVGGRSPVADFVSIPGSGTILTSPDGVSWVSQTLSSAAMLADVVWSGKQFVAVGNGTILTSPDGELWTPQDSKAVSGLNSVIWSGTQLVAVGLGGTVVTSPDGLSWTPQITGAPHGLQRTPYGLHAVAWSETQFVAVGDRGTILTSPDGVIWSTQNSLTINNLYSITWTGKEFLSTGGEIILTSP